MESLSSNAGSTSFADVVRKLARRVEPLLAEGTAGNNAVWYTPGHSRTAMDALSSRFVERKKYDAYAKSVGNSLGNFARFICC